jgi:hypothetical protein
MLPGSLERVLEENVMFRYNERNTRLCLRTNCWGENYVEKGKLLQQDEANDML